MSDIFYNNQDYDNQNYNNQSYNNQYYSNNIPYGQNMNSMQSDERVNLDVERARNARRKRGVNRGMAIVGIIVSIMVLISIFLPHAKNSTLLMMTQIHHEDTDNDYDESSTTYEMGKNMFFWSMISNASDYSKAYDSGVKMYEERIEQMKSSSYWDYLDSEKQSGYEKALDTKINNFKAFKGMALFTAIVEVICILILLIAGISYLIFFVNSVIRGSDVKKQIFGEAKVILIISTIMFMFVAGTYGSVGIGLWMIMIMGITALITTAVLGAYGDEKREIRNVGRYIAHLSINIVSLLGSIIALLFAGTSILDLDEVEAGIGLWIQLMKSYLQNFNSEIYESKDMIVKILLCMIILIIVVLAILYNSIEATANIKDRESLNSGILISSIMSIVLLIIYVIIMKGALKSGSEVLGDLNYAFFTTAMISCVLNIVLSVVRIAVGKDSLRTLQLEKN